MFLLFIEGFRNTYLVRLELDSKRILAPLWLEVKALERLLGWI